MSILYFKKSDERADDKTVNFDSVMEEKREKGLLRVLLIGSGGREAAMAWKISASRIVEKLYIAPGNGGTENYGINLPRVKGSDFESVAEAVQQHNINMIVVGPEAPLVEGIVDWFEERRGQFPDLEIVGPNAAGARLEGSKAFSKAFMKRYDIPTARYRSFKPEELELAERFLDTLQAPYVLKADALAAGKGVIIAEDRTLADKALQELFAGVWGEKGQQVVIEEFLSGRECSMFVATDGVHYTILPEAMDYKRIGDNNTGPNTGGMGAISPVPFVDEAFVEKVKTRIIEPTLRGLQEDGICYKGFLFLGLMEVKGDPYVIEYNCRMGDPETQAVMLRIKSDFGRLLKALATEQLDKYDMETDERAACCLVLASKGYPGSYVKGFEILLPEPSLDSIIFQAGTRRTDGKLVTDGGRVLSVASYGSTVAAASGRCYTVAEQILFDGKNYRHDIGKV